jgi:hypothetical protein
MRIATEIDLSVKVAFLPVVAFSHGSQETSTSGRGSGVVGYNLQVIEDHLIVTHEVTNVCSDRSQLARVVTQAKAALQTDTLKTVADRGYFIGEEIVACDQAGITVTPAKPMTSGAKSEGRSGKQGFAYSPYDDVYRCNRPQKSHAIGFPRRSLPRQ